MEHGKARLGRARPGEELNWYFTFSSAWGRRFAAVNKAEETEQMVATYRITLTGESPLLMHADNIGWAEVLKAWRRR